jgi:nucleoside-diphosphate-sugar epimerase
MKNKKVLVVGASGLVGYAVMKHYANEENCSVIAVSRRQPDETFGAHFISVDLTNEEQCQEVFSGMTDITHVVYTALYEKPNLISGWVEQDQIETNERMLHNLFEPLERASHGLTHVTLMQGAKAYGTHVRTIRNPAREGKSEMREQPNFYWRQEDYITQKQQGKSWNWTIFRPPLIVGESIGSAMNIIPAIGVYAALLKEEGKPLYFPGGLEKTWEVVDADLLARAIAWAGEADKAQGEVFNITNGEVFVWSNLWSSIAETLGMEPGESVPVSLKEEMPRRADDWARICSKYNLVAPDLKDFVGYSFEYADRYFMHGNTQVQPPALLSTVKIRQAGFQESMDNEVMFKKWFQLFQQKGLLPGT